MSNNKLRSPVVVVMGHIDHGKTTLLDFIRKSRVAARETGGITQGVSAYEIELGQQRITFIDTPGHEAFQLMRQRGARLADIAILVVAADDGVKPQTVEAIKAIKEQNLPLIVAINKIDKAPPDLHRLHQQLAEAGIMVEEYGGQVPVAAISALEGTGVNDLLDLILLTAEVAELANDEGAPATGFILETHRDPQSGILATAVIKNGTLREGDWVAAGGEVAKIKRLNNFAGQSEKTLTASAPAVLWGFSQLPTIGAIFTAATSRPAAEALAAEQKQKPKSPKTAKATDQSTATAENQRTINLIIKAEAAGSLDALRHEVAKLNDETVALNILAAETGNITVNDLKLAGHASEGLVVLGFRVKPEAGVNNYAQQHGIKLTTFEIIYQLADWLKEEVERQRPAPVPESPVGEAKILKIFKTEKDKQVVGGEVKTGKLIEGKRFNIVRRGHTLGQGRIAGLESQRQKVKEVEAGGQFGALVDVKTPLANGDVIELAETPPVKK
jgi:translation initiation factor IF-2